MNQTSRGKIDWSKDCICRAGMPYDENCQQHNPPKQEVEK